MTEHPHELRDGDPDKVDDVLRDLYRAGRLRRELLNGLHPEVERLRCLGRTDIVRLYPVTPEVERTAYGSAWQTRRRGILDRWDDALDAAASALEDEHVDPSDHRAGRVYINGVIAGTVDEHGNVTLNPGRPRYGLPTYDRPQQQHPSPPTMQSWTGQGHPGHNID